VVLCVTPADFPTLIPIAEVLASALNAEGIETSVAINSDVEQSTIHIMVGKKT
jgi:hypothetical protein